MLAAPAFPLHPSSLAQAWSSSWEGKHLLIHDFLEVGLQDDHQLLERHPLLHIDWNFLLVLLVFVLFEQRGENLGSLLHHDPAE